MRNKILFYSLTYMIALLLVIWFVIESGKNNERYQNELYFFDTLKIESMIGVEISNEAGGHAYLTDIKEIEGVYSLITRAGYKSIDISSFTQYRVDFHFDDGESYTLYVRSDVDSDVILVRYPNISDNYTHRGYDIEGLFESLHF